MLTGRKNRTNSKDVDLPYLETKIVKGRIYNYFRKGQVRIPLPRNKNSREFNDKNWEARTGKAKVTVKMLMVNAIAACKATPEYKALKNSTQTNYGSHFKDIIAKNRDKDIRSLKRKVIINARNALQETWSQANERVVVLSKLCKVAIDKDWRDTNPTIGVKKLTGGEFEPWPVEFQLAYIDYCEKY